MHALRVRGAFRLAAREASDFRGGFACLRLSPVNLSFHTQCYSLLIQMKKWKLYEKMLPLARLVTDPDSDDGFCADPTLPAVVLPGMLSDLVGGCTGAGV